MSKQVELFIIEGVFIIITCLFTFGLGWHQGQTRADHWWQTHTSANIVYSNIIRQSVLTGDCIVAYPNTLFEDDYFIQKAGVCVIQSEASGTRLQK